MKKRVKNCRLKYSIHITKAQNKTSGTMKTHHNWSKSNLEGFVWSHLALLDDLNKSHNITNPNT